MQYYNIIIEYHDDDDDDEVHNEYYVLYWAVSIESFPFMPFLDDYDQRNVETIYDTEC